MFFERYGAVRDVKVIADKSGSSKGYGFVTFEHEEDAKKIIKDEVGLVVLSQTSSLSFLSVITSKITTNSISKIELSILAQRSNVKLFEVVLLSLITCYPLPVLFQVVISQQCFFPRC